MGHRREIDCVGSVMSTEQGRVAVCCVYAPPGFAIGDEIWATYLDGLLPYSTIFFCGDFNAHHTSWGCTRSSPRGQALFESSLRYDLVPINDSLPTYVPGSGATPSNIDLIFCPLSIFHLARGDVVSDPCGSDHLPVVLTLGSAVSAVPRPSCRINTREVSWSAFHERLDAELPRLRGSLGADIAPAAVYGEFMRVVLRHLLDSGAKRPEGTGKKRRTQPLWWSKECEQKIRERRDSYKAYYGEQTAERKAEFKRVLREAGVGGGQYAEPFTRREFDSAISACRVRSSPGLDGFSYEILRRFSEEVRAFLLDLFNAMFRSSSYPSSWRDTYVIFIPKLGGRGYRPISLTSSVCKLFERLVQRRLEHQAELLNWIPNFQFVFRRGRSAMDAVAMVTTDILQGFGCGESVVAVSVDIKGAFNSVLPDVLSDQLGLLGVSSEICNFIAYITARRELCFSADGSGSRTCGVGVPQGGVLSPILFNIYTSRIIDVLPLGIRYAMYADDLFLYTRGRSIAAARDMLAGALSLVIPWLRTLGFDISIGKCQFAVFSRLRCSLSELVLTVEGHDLPCLAGIKYLGVVLDRRLTWAPHIRMLAHKAMKSVNIIRVLARISWGATPSLLLTAYRNLVRSTLEWGSPLFSSASGGTLRLLDRVQYSALRAVLGCMKSTPIPILLSEAGEPPLWLRGHLLNNRFIIRNFYWRGNPLIPKLELLVRRFSSSRRFRSLRSSLMVTYQGLRDVLGMVARSVRPGYFDWPWRTVALPVDIDLEMGQLFKNSENPGRACLEYLGQNYSEYAAIYTDGSVEPGSGRAGCGFYVERDDFRNGLSLQLFTSVLSVELFAILKAVQYAGRVGLSRVLVLTDSWRVLTSLRDCTAASVGSYLVYKIAYELAGLRDSGGGVEFMWVPGHVGIVGNEVADRVAGVARELPYDIRFGLPFCDLYDPIGRDYDSWVRLLWPYTGFGGASCVRYFNRVAFKSDRPWFSRVRAPRRSICLITRLRTGHVCTGDHFRRMGWDLKAGCSCGAPLCDLVHVLHACPLLAESRPGFYAFLSERFPDRRPEEIPIEDLVFDPGPAVVGALAGHLERTDRVL